MKNLLKQEMMGWKLDHMQIISTSLQADNHASLLFCSRKTNESADAT